MSLDLRRDQYDGLGKLTRDNGSGVDLQDVVTELAWRDAEYVKAAADAAAVTATAETPFHGVQTHTQKVDEAWFFPAAALTANASNYATLTVRRRKADGSDGDVLFQLATNVVTTGDWTAFVPVQIPKLTGTVTASYTLADGESLTLAIAKTGTGVVVPAGVLKVHYK